MAAAIALRCNFTGADLRRLARRTQDAKRGRRLLALARSTMAAVAVMPPSRRCRLADQSGLGDAVQHRGPDGLIDRKAPGPEPRLNDEYSTALAAAIESDPIAAFHGVVRWRPADLCQWLWEEFRVSIARQTLRRELHSLGYRKLTAQPRHHAPAEGAIEHFKELSLPPWQTSCRIRTSSVPR